MPRLSHQQQKLKLLESIEKNYLWHKRKFEEVQHHKPSCKRYIGRKKALDEALRIMNRYYRTNQLVKILNYAA